MNHQVGSISSNSYNTVKQHNQQNSHILYEFIQLYTWNIFNLYVEEFYSKEQCSNIASVKFEGISKFPIYIIFKFNSYFLKQKYT